MADWGGNSLNKSSDFGGGSMGNEDFDEEDVSGVAKENDDLDTKTKRVSKEYSSSSSSAWHKPAAPRNIPRANILPDISDAKVVQRSSGPMDIPDWSQIYGKNGKKGLRDGVCSYGDDHYHNNGDEDEDNDELVPPHEWLARKLARNQISSSSVCEGFGRTLKGRDLSKVRNAILTKTGFIE